jgi:hypothetical protein
MGSIERKQTRGRRREWTYIVLAREKADRLRNSKRRSMGKSRRIQNRRKSRVGPSPARNKYRRNEPRRKGKRKSKRGAEEGDNKNMG